MAGAACAPKVKETARNALSAMEFTGPEYREVVFGGKGKVSASQRVYVFGFKSSSERVVEENWSMTIEEWWTAVDDYIIELRPVHALDVAWKQQSGGAAND
jgi:hypothetical protein